MDATLAPPGLEDACRRAGLFLGRQRLAVVRTLSEAHDHPTPDDILKRARLIDPKISQATIYRTLAILHEHGLIFRHDFGDGKTRYEDAAHGPHDHIIDAETGAILNHKDAGIEASLREFMRRRGYHLRDYRLDLLCSSKTPPRWGGAFSRRVARTQ